MAQVVERVTGRPVDLAALLENEKKGGSAKGARILEDMGKDDVLALHLYQFIAEGRAHRVWQRMSEVCEDSFVSAAYARIARDEKSHREFGRQGLESMEFTPEMKEKALKMAAQIRKELYTISCMNCVEVPVPAVAWTRMALKYLNKAL